MTRILMTVYLSIGRAKPSAPFITTGIPAYTWQTIIIIVLPVAHMGM